MRFVITLSLCSVLLGCEGDKVDAMAKIRWQIDYSDPSDDARVPDLRNCDNQPTPAVVPLYRAIANVHLVIVDPEGQVPGIDNDFPCAQGYGGKFVPIMGLAKQVFALTLEAETADGTVLYRYTNKSYDVTAFREDTFVLTPTTGEVVFYPEFDGSSECPTDVVAIDYTMYRYDTDLETTPTVTGILDPACTGGFTNEVLVREVPVIQDDPRRTYNSFKLVLEAKSASGATLHCGINESRVVHPGVQRLGGDETLLAGTCPPAEWTCSGGYDRGDGCHCECGAPDPDCALINQKLIGCGTSHECTTCNVSGQCAACIPDCDGRVCGDDGCHGSCGTCAGTCNADGSCVGTVCGPNSHPNTVGDVCVCDLGYSQGNTECECVSPGVTGVDRAKLLNDLNQSEAEQVCSWFGGLFDGTYACDATCGDSTELTEDVCDGMLTFLPCQVALFEDCFLSQQGDGCPAVTTQECEDFFECAGT